MKKKTKPYTFTLLSSNCSGVQPQNSCRQLANFRFEGGDTDRNNEQPYQK